MAQKHQCYQCGDIHPRPGFVHPKHFGYECPNCSTNLAFPTKAQVKSWNIHDNISVFAFIAFPLLFLQMAFRLQSVTLSIAVVIFYGALLGMLHRFQPAPILLEHIDEIYSAMEKKRLGNSDSSANDIDSNIARYHSQLSQNKQSKAWWQFWR